MKEQEPVSETKQPPKTVQLTAEEASVYGPFCAACNEQIRLFAELMDQAQKLMLQVILAARAAAGTPDEESTESPAPPIVVQ